MEGKRESDVEGQRERDKETERRRRREAERSGDREADKPTDVHRCSACKARQVFQRLLGSIAKGCIAKVAKVELQLQLRMVFRARLARLNRKLIRLQLLLWTPLRWTPKPFRKG